MNALCARRTRTRRRCSFVGNGRAWGGRVRSDAVKSIHAAFPDNGEKM